MVESRRTTKGDNVSTYRERRLAKADRYEEWAGKRQAKADAAEESARAKADMIPFGQPVISGHHSEGRHRNHLKKIQNGFRSAWENQEKAASMAAKAATIRAQAENAIYSDDPDAAERLRERLEWLEARRNSVNAYNKSCRDGKPDPELLHPEERKYLNGPSQVVAHCTKPDGQLAAFVSTNLGGTIRTTRKRLEAIESGS